MTYTGTVDDDWLRVLPCLRGGGRGADGNGLLIAPDSELHAHVLLLVEHVDGLLG